MKRISKLLACLVILGGLISFSACSDDDDEHVYPVTAITISNAQNGAVSMVVGKTAEMKITYAPENATDIKDFKVTYTTSDDKIFTVSETGVVTAVAEGTGILNVVVDNGTKKLSAKCEVIVKKEGAEPDVPVTAIELADVVKDGWKTDEIGKTLDLSAAFKVKPETATDKTVTYVSADPKVATVDAKGLLTVVAVGTTKITITAADGSGVKAEFTVTIEKKEEPTPPAGPVTYLDRKGWTATASHDTPTDPNPDVKGTPDCVIDGDLNSCLILVKSGKTIGTVTVPNEAIFFTLDMKKKQEFNTIKLTNRTSNSQERLRATEITLLGSNDGGSKFETIQEKVTLNPTEVFTEVALSKTVNYQFVKVMITGYDELEGNSVQVAEFELGLAK